MSKQSNEKIQRFEWGDNRALARKRARVLVGKLHVEAHGTSTCKCALVTELVAFIDNVRATEQWNAAILRAADEIQPFDQTLACMVRKLVRE